MGRKANKKGGARRGIAPSRLRRDESHQASHSRHEAEPLDPIVAHPLAAGGAPVTVTSGGAMAEMIEHLKDAGSFAFDSEFIGEQSYTPRLCLVQAATTRQVFLLDPLVGLDLSDFWALIVSAAPEKIVLAGQQDFIPTVEATGRPPANVLDVQIAAGFVHEEYPLSLARLLEEFVGKPPGKPLGFTRWDKRPLSAVQLRYAADDVRHLPAARDAIGKRLTELGRAAWARAECAAALEEISLYRPAPESLYLRVRGRERLRQRPLGVLRELAIVRDRAARQENVPTRTLLKDRILLALARRPVAKLADLDAVKGLPRPVEARYGRQIVTATATAMALPEDALPPAAPAETAPIRRRADELWERIGRRCRERSIAATLVASRKEVGALCCAAAAGESLATHRLGRGWRRELLDDLLAAL